MCKIEVYDSNKELLEIIAEENDTTVAEILDELLLNFSAEIMSMYSPR